MVFFLPWDGLQFCSPFLLWSSWLSLKVLLCAWFLLHLIPSFQGSAGAVGWETAPASPTAAEETLPLDPVDSDHDLPSDASDSTRLNPGARAFEPTPTRKSPRKPRRSGA